MARYLRIGCECQKTPLQSTSGKALLLRRPRVPPGRMCCWSSLATQRFPQREWFVCSGACQSALGHDERSARFRAPQQKAQRISMHCQYSPSLRYVGIDAPRCSPTKMTMSIRTLCSEGKGARASTLWTTDRRSNTMGIFGCMNG